MRHPYGTGWSSSGRRTCTALPFVGERARQWCAAAAEGTGQASVLDEPAPPLLPAVGTGNRPAAGQGPLFVPVGECPLPRLPLQLTAGRLVAPACPGRTYY